MFQAGGEAGGLSAVPFAFGEGTQLTLSRPVHIIVLRTVDLILREIRGDTQHHIRQSKT